jgi:hypothetical protein
MRPGEWLTSARLKTINLMICQAFVSVSQFLVKLEDGDEDWHLATIPELTNVSHSIQLISPHSKRIK